MNDEDRKFLTEWGGDCWHDAENDGTCTKCGKSFRGYYFCSVNRTFDNWNDFGWLIEKLGTTKLLWNFVSHWRQGGGGKYFDAPITQMVEWEVLKPGIRCQLICDFLREQEGKG